MFQSALARISAALLVAALATVATAPTSADTLVLPAALENVDGNTANTGPFGKLSVEFNAPFRTQQIFAGTAFESIGDVIRIDELRYRPDFPQGDAGTRTANDIEISLSTTAKEVDGLDFTDLDLNVGVDAEIVYSGSLTFTSCDCGSPTRAFDVVVTFQTPFYYDPMLGNLLIDFVNTSNPYPLAFLIDAHDADGDETSRLVEVIQTSNGEHVILGQNISLGLVTQFVYTVPEASGLGAGLAAMLALAARKRAHSA